MENKYQSLYKKIMNDSILENIKQRAVEYGVRVKIIEYKIEEDWADSGYYIVAGVPDYPEYNNPMELVNDMNRNENLFYLKQFAIKLEENNIQFAIESFFDYCQKIELLQCLYKEYDCELPEVIRLSEYSTIQNLNKDWNNPELDLFARRECKDALDKFFASEKKAERKGATYKWKKFYRSDLYDNRRGKKHFNVLKAFTSDDQIVPLSTLTHCSKYITTIDLEEAEYQKLREALKKHPKVYFSVDDKIVIDHGKISGGDPWENEQSRFEVRNIYFKKVDEPVIMGELYYLRYKDYALPRECIPVKKPVSKNVSWRCINNFVSEAKRRNLNFAIDKKGTYLKASTEYVPVLFSPDQLHKYNSIMSDIMDFHINYHNCEESNLPYLDDVIKSAEEKLKAQEQATPAPRYKTQCIDL